MTLLSVSGATDLPLASAPNALPNPLASNSAVASDDARQAGKNKKSESIFALHLVNGEHYSGAERVQDLLARQLPQFGCEVGFACVKPERFPNARETKTAPL